MAPTLNANSAEVWYRETVLLDERAIRQAVQLLSVSEQVRYERLLTSSGRRDYACAHALLRTVLSRFERRPPETWSFEVAPGGKPVLPSGDPARISFNLSHTEGVVACIVAPGHEVGVDVEIARRGSQKERVAARYFSVEENAELAACGDDERASRFVEFWTLKEAYLKAIGKGLADRLDDVSFDLRAPGRIRFTRSQTRDLNQWQFATFEPTPEHRVAVAIRRDNGYAVRIVAINADAPTKEPLAPVRTSCPGNAQ